VAEICLQDQIRYNAFGGGILLPVPILTRVFLQASCVLDLVYAFLLPVEHRPHSPQTTSLHPALSCAAVSFAPAKPEARCPYFLFHIVFPSVSRSSFYSVALWLSLLHLFGNVVIASSHCVSNPVLLSSFSLFYHWLFTRFIPQFLVGYSVWPVYIQNFSQAFINKHLNSVYTVLCVGLTAEVSDA